MELHVRFMAASDWVICLNGHICCEGTPTVSPPHPNPRALSGRNGRRLCALSPATTTLRRGRDRRPTSNEHAPGSRPAAVGSTGLQYPPPPLRGSGLALAAAPLAASSLSAAWPHFVTPRPNAASPRRRASRCASRSRSAPWRSRSSWRSRSRSVGARLCDGYAAGRSSPIPPSPSGLVAVVVPLGVSGSTSWPISFGDIPRGQPGTDLRDHLGWCRAGGRPHRMALGRRF